MPDKEPVLLTVLIETRNLRWFVAGVGLNGAAIPLLRSEHGNLSPYLGVPLDHQVDFLRHRLSGVLQRGCDRLWGRQKKPCQLVFLTDGNFDPAVPELTQRVAEHFVEWMARPPVVFLAGDGSFAAQNPDRLVQVAGNFEPQFREALLETWPKMIAALTDEDQWELAPTKKTVVGGSPACHNDATNRS